MDKAEQLLTAFDRRYQDIRESPSIEKTMIHGRWLHEWKPERYPDIRLRHVDYQSYREAPYTLSHDKQADREFIRFVGNALLKIDPSDDQKYFPMMARWFLAGMGFDDAKKVPKLLNQYNQIIEQNPAVRSDPFRFFEIGGGQRNVKRRPVNKDPIKAAYTFRDLENFITTYKTRQERAKSFTPHKARADIDPNDVIHSGEHFHLYKKGGHDFKELVVLELANGARYSFELKSNDTHHFLDVKDEKGRACMAERMIRDIPGLADTLTPLITEFSKPEFEDGFRPDTHSEPVLKFAAGLKFANKLSPLEGGLIATAFEEKYNYIMRHLVKSETEDPDANVFELRKWDLKRTVKDGLQSLHNDLSTLSGFPEEQAQISADFIGDLIVAAAETGASTAMARALPVVNANPQWRAQISSQRISLVFNELAHNASRGEPYNQDHKTLVSLMTFVSKTPHWMDQRPSTFPWRLIIFSTQRTGAV